MSFVSKKTRVERLLKSKASRDAYVLENIKRMVPFQIRTMREEREWSQAQAGEAIGKPQNVISRLESPAYGKLTLQTLLDIAKGFDVGLLIKFVPFSRLVREYEDLSPEALSAKSLSDEKEVAELRAWGRIAATTTAHVETTPSYLEAIKAISVEELLLRYGTAEIAAERKGNILSPFISRGTAQPAVSEPVSTAEDFMEANHDSALGVWFSKHVGDKAA